MARARIVLIRTRAKRVLGILVTSVQEKGVCAAWIGQGMVLVLVLVAIFLKIFFY